MARIPIMCTPSKWKHFGPCLCFMYAQIPIYTYTYSLTHTRHMNTEAIRNRDIVDKYIIILVCCKAWNSGEWKSTVRTMPECPAAHEYSGGHTVPCHWYDHDCVTCVARVAFTQKPSGNTAATFGLKSCLEFGRGDTSGKGLVILYKFIGNWGKIHTI